MKRIASKDAIMVFLPEQEQNVIEILRCFSSTQILLSSSLR